ncbi:AAA family ATPase [Exiguobacterium artemiae]
MSNKIKSIEIDSFRIYQDKQVFSFDSDLYENKVADLIVIYAPNGFGKTSIIDAIEWTLTGSVRRLEEFAKIEKGRILANKNNDTQKAGSVKLLLESNDFINVETKKLIGNRQTDWINGDIIESSNKFQSIYSEKRRQYL